MTVEKVRRLAAIAMFGGFGGLAITIFIGAFLINFWLGLIILLCSLGFGGAVVLDEV